jgi:Flp pilus assembly pilin Flp
MHFLTDRRGASIAEAIVYTLIALVAGGAAVWTVFNAVAGRFNAIANGL